MIGCEGRCGPWLVDKGLLGIMVALADSPHPSLGALDELGAGPDGVVNSVYLAAGVGKPQEEVAKYAGSKLFVGECVFGVFLPEL